MNNWSLSPSERISITTAVSAQVREALDDAVAQARAAGGTWDEIATALGVARQSAWRRFKEERDVKKKQKRCSFCGLHQKDTTHLVAAPTGAAICDECVRLATSMIDAKTSRSS